MQARWRVMIVEDDPVLAIELQEMLEAIGCDVASRAGSVLSALRVLQGTPLPQGALLDCNLGGAKVWPVADALGSRSVPFAFTTGYSIADIEPRFVGTPVLVKPFGASMLERVFLPLLDRSHKKPSML